MNFRTIISGFAAAAVAAGILTPFTGYYAAEKVYADVRQESINAQDIIDESRKGSITVYKYDITAAGKDGVYEKGEREASGTKDSALSEKLKKYSISGVKYGYLRLGRVETVTSGNASDINTGIVYELPVQLADILGLKKGDAVNMSEGEVTEACDGQGGKLLHFSSSTINSAVKEYLEADNISAKNALESYIIENGADGILTTDENGTARADNLPLGLYLMVELEVPEDIESTTDPWFISLPYTYSAGDVHGEDGDVIGSDDAGDADSMAGNNWAYDIYCYPKNQTGTPVLEGKLVRNAEGKAAEKPGQKEGEEFLITEFEKDGFASERPEYEYDESTTASEGDVLDYIIVTKLPHIENKATYLTEYSFEDVLSKGISYNRDPRIAVYDNKDDAMVNNTEKAADIWAQDDYFTVSYKDSEENKGASVMNAALNAKGLEAVNTSGLSEHYLVLYYSAVVKSDDSVVMGDLGNENDVTMTWRRTNSDYADSYKDQAYVYSYALDLKKEFTGGDGDASKVCFTLYNESDGYYICTDSPENKDGVYHITGKSDKKEDASVLSPGENGTMKVFGLEADRYLLTETATDKGFSLLKSPVSIDIRSSEETEGQAHATVSGSEADMEASAGEESNDGSTASSEHAFVKITVENTKSFTLPQTGGNGLYAVTITGAVSIAAGCFIVSRRKKHGV